MTTKAQRRQKKELARVFRKARRAYVRKMGSHVQSSELRFYRGKFEEMLGFILSRPVVVAALKEKTWTVKLERGLSFSCNKRTSKA